jgi:Na+/proline symporter
MDWNAASWGFVVSAQVLFAILGLYLAYSYKKRNGGESDTLSFITAKDSVGISKIGWSFYAGAVGAWVIVAPSSYATFAGIIGLVMYALASGIPLLLVALFGQSIQEKHPNVTSSADFVGFRFGPVAQLLFVLLSVFNMTIAMLAEYTTMASLFKDFVGTVDYPIVIVQGGLTLVYTAAGGLLVSIITDYFQGVASIVLLTTLVSYVASTFRYPLESPLPEYLAGTNTFGYSSIFTLPLSLTAATFFSEAMWQRCWASKDRRTLYLSAALGCVLTSSVVFLFGFGGFLAAWANLIDFDTANPNLYLFQVFKDQNIQGSSRLRSWVSLITLISAGIMSESAVDSIQTGLLGVLSVYFLKNRPIKIARILVVLINIPLIIIALQGYNVLSLFLVTNMLCVCAMIPFGLGLWHKLDKIYTGDNAVFAFVFAFLFTSGYGIGSNWDPNNISESFSYGFWFTWYGNGYLWDYFAIALGSSVLGVIIGLGVRFVILELLDWKLTSLTALVERYYPYSPWTAGTEVNENKNLQGNSSVESSVDIPKSKEQVELNEK